MVVIAGLLIGVWLTGAAVLAVIIHDIPGASGGNWLYAIGASLTWPFALLLVVYDWIKEQLT